MTPSRMEQILHARNIQGILLPPQGDTLSHMDDFCFDRFSVVSFGYTLTSPQLHTVTLHHYRAMELVCRRLMELGYQKPGLVLSEPDDSRTDHIWSAAFRSEQRLLPVARRLPICTGKTMDERRFKAWFRRYKPDVVVASRKAVYGWMVEEGVKVPEDVGFAFLGATPNDSPFSGIWQNLQVTGAKALDLLVDMLHRGERGIPEIRSNLLIDATWIDGKTIRSK